jgi:hypothetical protein
MTPHFARLIRIHLYKLIVLGLFVSTVGAGLTLYFSTNPKWDAIFAGLATGLFVALIQYLLNWNEHSDIEAVKKLGIIKILPHRDDRMYYGELLAGVRREVWVLGNTGSRFLEDFAHASRSDSQQLLAALGRGIQVRFLLPDLQFVEGNDSAKAQAVRIRLTDLKKQYTNFDYRYFNHRATLSLVRIDEQCLFGPIFSNRKSKDSPTIHTLTDGPFVQAHLQYFESEWSDAKAA